MSVLDAPELVPVPVGYCPCAREPHPDGDIVYLHPELSMQGGLAAQGAIAEGTGDLVLLQELLARVWITHGVAAWTFVDDEGNPIPVTPANVARALPYAKGGRLIADKADDLYHEAILAPLGDRLEALRKLSQPGSTPSTPRATSRGKASRPKRR
jgi:hypothetical protein